MMAARYRMDDAIDDWLKRREKQVSKGYKIMHAEGLTSISFDDGYRVEVDTEHPDTMRAALDNLAKYVSERSEAAKAATDSLAEARRTAFDKNDALHAEKRARASDKAVYEANLAQTRNELAAGKQGLDRAREQLKEQRVKLEELQDTHHSMSGRMISRVLIEHGWQPTTGSAFIAPPMLGGQSYSVQTAIKIHVAAISGETSPGIAITHEAQAQYRNASPSAKLAAIEKRAMTEAKADIEDPTLPSPAPDNPSAIRQIGTNFAAGALVAAQIGASRTLTTLTTEALEAAGMPREMLDHPLVRGLIQLGAPALLRGVAPHVPGVGDSLNGVLNHVQIGATASVGGEVIGAVGDKVMPILRALKEQGAKLSMLEGDTQPERVEQINPE